jgi:hypothetical protein
MTGYDPEWLKNLIRILTAEKEQWGETFTDQILIIFDDMGESELKKDKNFQSLFTLGRHLNISVMSINQYINQLPKNVRNNLNYVVLGQITAQSLEMVYKEFITIPKKEFYQIYTANVIDYHFLIVCCDSVKNNDYLFSVIYNDDFTKNKKKEIKK